MEWQRTVPWPKVDRNSEKNGNVSRHGNNEKLPRISQLSQQVYPSFSRVKQPTQRDMQAENGIQAYTCLQSCFSVDKGGNFQNVTLPYFNPNTSTILQTHASKRGLGTVLLQNSKPGMFASRTLTGSESNYQNLEQECLAYNMGHGKVTLFSLWKGIHLGNGSKATGVHLQEAHGGNFPKDPEIDIEKLPISAFQFCVQERSGNSTRQYTKSCYTVTNGRGWNSATNYSRELGDSKHSIQFQWIG